MKIKYCRQTLILTALSLIFFFAPARAESFHEKEYLAIFDYLMKNDWSENGDWKGDMMGDANWFATVLLFETGQRDGDTELISRAAKSAEWEKSVFTDTMKALNAGKIPENITATIGGLPGLFYGYKFLHKEEFKNAMEEAMDFSYGLAKKPSNESLFKSFGLDHVVLLAATAYACSQIYLETKEEKYKDYVLTLMETADIVYWDDDEKYYGDLWDWAEGSMLLALAGAYQMTGDEKYAARAKELFAAMLNKLWDKENGGIRTKSHFELRNAKVLSGNNLFTTAMIEWHKLTKDKTYLEYAKKTVDFVLSPVLFDGKIIYHHNDKNGRAKYHCTGCMFHTLLNVYELNKL